MANPNPTRISDPMWRFWVDFKKFEPTAKLGGIYADKAGYHNFRSDLPGTDYSVKLSNDKLGPSGKASAWDLTLPTNKMKLYTKRLVDACKRRDPRLFRNGQPIIREVIGTLDGETVYCYVLTGGKALGVDADSGPDSGRDKSHLWHIHISLIRRFIEDEQAIAGILAILKGESLNDGGSDVAVTDADASKIANRVWSATFGPEMAGQKLTQVDQRAESIEKELKAVRDQLTALVNTPPGAVVISDEQLERVLRKVIGSVDAA